MKSLGFLLVIVSHILFADVQAQCGDGWTLFKEENKCIKVYETTVTARKHAMTTCVMAHGRLLTIHNEATQNFIKELVKDKTSLYWIGLTDWIKEGSYMWPDGKKMSGYQNWGANQPDDARGNEDCVNIAGKDLQWNDIYCDAPNVKFICEKLGPGCQHNNGGCRYDCSDAIDSSWRTHCSGRCEKGFVGVNGHCYDIDECSYDNGGCPDGCRNNRGSFRCFECDIDYTWDGTKCAQDDDTLIG